jgi:hypothetical protein
VNLFPQLPHHIARQLAEAARSLPIESLAASAVTEHQACEYTPTGGARATTTQLRGLRERLLQLALAGGYPLIPGQVAVSTFDAEVAIVLVEQMQMAPAEAAKGGVWEFLSCVLLPDLVRWRFSGTSGATSLERFVAGRRNVFQRLWWRAFHLAARSGGAFPVSDLLRSLGEDELVQLMERPSLAGIEGLPAAIASGLLAASKAHPELTRRVLIREAQKRFLRLSSFLAIESIAEAELLKHVDGVFEQVAAALASDAQPAQA